MPFVHVHIAAEPVRWKNAAAWRRPSTDAVAQHPGGRAVPPRRS